jgi:hypothetical protein
MHFPNLLCPSFILWHWQMLLQVAMELQQSKLNLILEAVQNNQPASSSLCRPSNTASQPQPCNKHSQAAEVISASPFQPTLVGARVSWGCGGPKISRKKAAHKGGGCLLPTPETGGASAVMQDMQSCGKH